MISKRASAAVSRSITFVVTLMLILVSGGCSVQEAIADGFFNGISFAVSETISSLLLGFGMNG